MRVGIFGTGITTSSASHLNEMLDEVGIEHFNLNSKTKSKKVDCILVMGGDKGVRNYFHRTFDSSIPVLGINESESDGFLTQVDLKQFAVYAKRLKKWIIILRKCLGLV